MCQHRLSCSRSGREGGADIPVCPHHGSRVGMEIEGVPGNLKSAPRRSLRVSRQAGDVSAQMGWRGFRATSNRVDGRFFAPLRMTCFALGICKMFRPHVCQECHPEEALSAEPGPGRRQADEGSPAATIHACIFVRVPSLIDGTFAPSRPRRGGANVDWIPIYGHFDKPFRQAQR